RATEEDASMRRWILVIAWALLLAACNEPPADDASEDDGATPEESVPEGEPPKKRTSVGPGTAVVTLTPAAPSLGDRVSLELRVNAEPGVDIELPAFGEQLGRFGIVDFQQDESDTPQSHVAWQRYTLDLPMSGRQRIPPLLVEFYDRRPNRPD